MRTALILICLCAVLLTPSLHAASQTVITGPAGSAAFGSSTLLLPNGNFVVLDPGFDQPSPALTNVGMVSLYRHDGTLISTLTGSSSNDSVGSAGVALLRNGNFVVVSPLWNNGGTADVGAVTWGHAETGFGAPSVVISSANSLTGTNAVDLVGNGFVTVLANGNYVVLSTLWNNVGTVDAGAATLCDGSTGRVGTVNASNSLVGGKSSDFSFSTVTALTNGNYVVSTPFCDNGATLDTGAVTWGDGVAGITGTISTAKSLMGSSANDSVGTVRALKNGNYVVISQNWSQPSPAIAFAGAVTFCNGTTGLSGTISAGNSLIGTSAFDRVGAGGLELANGNYLVLSRFFDQVAPIKADVGAITWCSGTAGVKGPVSATNSLIGQTASDLLGDSLPLVLTNGNYVVLAPEWDHDGVVDAGAAMWCNGSSGEVGTLLGDRALVGQSTNDRVGADGVPLTNGNYVVVSDSWSNPATSVSDVGAVTFGNGKTGIRGAVSQGNSLVGKLSGDQVGAEGAVALTNGNYVVVSDRWQHPSTLVDCGAITFCNGATGTKGLVTPGNSLLGSTAGDLDDALIQPLPNGNYVVVTIEWDLPDPNTADVGAVTFGNGKTGIKGVISEAISLVGATAGDRLGSGGVTVLANGNYVVASPTHDSVFLRADSGAATWGSGTSGVKGIVSESNSLVGFGVLDRVGERVVGLANGHYAVISPTWNSGLVDGAVTLGNGVTGTTGTISPAHSVLGVTASDANFIVLFDPVHEQVLIARQGEQRLVLYGNNLRSVAKTGLPAPGGVDLTFGAAGLTVINPIGALMWDSSLTGAGSSGGRNSAIFALAPGFSVADLVMQKADDLSALGAGLPANAKVAGLGSHIFNQMGRGLFQATVSGTGITGANNKLLLMDTGANVTPVHRLGQPVPGFANAVFVSMPSITQSRDRDRVVMSYQLKSNPPAGVTAVNDSGVLTMSHAGGLESFILREGANSFINATGLVGNFGQFTPLVSSSSGSVIHFVSGHVSSTGTRTVLQSLETAGNLFFGIVGVGGAAPDMVGPENGVVKVGSIPGVTSLVGSALYKATLTGTASATNEAVYAGNVLMLRKGSTLDPFFNFTVKKIIAWWPVQSTQSVYLLEVNGAGTSAPNNLVLALRQDMTSANTPAFGRFLTLTLGSHVRDGVSPAKIGRILAVEVNPASGDYAVLTTLTNCPASTNQALWTGNTLAGTAGSVERLPVLRLRKGDRYSTNNTPLGIIKSIGLKPVPDTSGARGRGLGSCVGADGSTAVYITGDGNKTELVLLK
ncbi:MAG: hypothetical protein JNJ83_09045 [Verrucomicrobiaceae bacterium]|nr:hypothetical protein [Verrucomicrobiaceae bacterium]